MTGAGRGLNNRELAKIAADLRSKGASNTQIAERLCIDHGASGRAAWRLALGWSQKDSADRWNELWPDNPKTAKNISYWELWPSTTGYKPSLDVLRSLATIYGCRVADLLIDVGDQRLGDGIPVLLADRAQAELQEQHTSDNADWFTESFRALLRLDLETPEVISERTIVSRRNDLSVIDTFVSAPRNPGDKALDHRLNLELLFGGELVHVEQPSESQFRYVVDLATPLSVGDKYTYILRAQVPEGQQMASHLVQTPLSRTDRFYLRARFSRHRLPARVWLLDGIAPSVLYDPEPTSGQLAPDRHGEINVEFSNLRLGWVYGIRWV